MSIVRPCVTVTAALLFICCGVYPAAVTALAQGLFPREANGSLIVEHGKVRGSSLLGQTLDRPMEHLEYFWPRPSAASVDSATGVLVSGGSNYGPLNKSLEDEVTQRVAALRATGVTGPIPVDLVTKSGSGLDPHISVAAAQIQVPRVARARGIPEEEVASLVRANTQGSTLGFLGDPRVNVLELNLALDRKKAVPPVVSPVASAFAVPSSASAAPSVAPVDAGAPPSTP